MIMGGRVLGELDTPDFAGIMACSHTLDTNSYTDLLEIYSKHRRDFARHHTLKVVW